MMSNHKALPSARCGAILLCLLFFLPVHAFCQVEGPDARPLLVGLTNSPPAYIKNAEGQWEGFSVELWRAVAQIMGVTFEFREFDSLDSLLGAIEKYQIDVIPSLSVQDRFEPYMDFSQSYLKSGLSIAVPAQEPGLRWANLIRSLFSLQILKAVALLLLMSLIFGTIVWAFERRCNRDMFADRFKKGIGDGIWWAMVTLSTVGYGDKAPKTVGGRISAFIWMIFSIAFIAGFTATITAELTVTSLEGRIRGFNDLYQARVGSISGSEGFDYLTRKGIAVIAFGSTKEGLSAVADNRVDAFVNDEKILNYIIKTDFPGRLQVVGGTFEEYFVSVALQQKSPIRKPINKALLKLMKTEQWSEILNRYIK